jgi:hypothetical protein
MPQYRRGVPSANFCIILCGPSGPVVGPPLADQGYLYALVVVIRLLPRLIPVPHRGLYFGFNQWLQGCVQPVSKTTVSETAQLVSLLSL